MSEARGALGAFARSPGWQLVVGGLVLALAFPSRLPGSIGFAIVLGGLGVGIAQLWPRIPARWRQVSPRVRTLAALGVVFLLGIDTFWDTLVRSPDWQLGDWGPQHAVLARALDALPGWDLPSWNHVVGTGDTPFELYPQVAYLVTGHLALALGLERDLPHAYMIVAVLVHLGSCLLVTAIGMRVAPRPVAAVVGVMCVVESGAVSEGGPVDLFRWALLHSALSLSCFLVAALGIVALLERPRLRAVIAIWIATAIATIAHPAGLLVVGGACAGLLGVVLLAHDVPRRRGLVAIGHVLVGVALGAAVWMPLAARILEYAQHFPNRVGLLWQVLDRLVSGAWPTTTFALLTCTGLLGIVVGLWSRRAVPVFLAVTTMALLLGTSDVPWLATDLAPGPGVARLGSVRLVALARPFLAMCAALGFGVIAIHAIAGWRRTTRSRQLVAAAVCGLLGGIALRELPPWWEEISARAFATTRTHAPDPAGRTALVAWANEQMRTQRPGAWGRALVESDTHEHFHLTALTALPTFHMSAQPDLLLRERIEDTSPESLRRFNVRWIIASDQSPTLGDPATEVTLGSFRIRQVAGWDGQFARIERGTGMVRTTHLDDAAVVVEVTGTEPVLVALGTGYYPRWRAQHASGAREPVFALPTIAGGTLHVVSAWVAPGTTTFTCDGALPSDGKGTALTMLVGLAVLVGMIAWRVPRVRRRALRRLARLRQRVRPGVGVWLPRVAVPLGLAVLLMRGCYDAATPAKALELGTGLRGLATVEARLATDADWQTCAYSRVTGAYTCEGLVTAFDRMANLLNDALPSWNFSTPAISASALLPGVEIQVTANLRLAGAYWMAASPGSVILTVAGEPSREVTREILRYDDRGVRAVRVRAALPTTAWSLAFVHADTLVPAQPHLVAPPTIAPDAVRAIQR